MPLVINEIRVVTEVSKPDGAAPPASAAPKGEDRAKLVAEITEQVLRTLREQRER
jgi:phenylpyruvate tautomerase PptA (4-oxalocrotonate tautomerase family)